MFREEDVYVFFRGVFFVYGYFVGRRGWGYVFEWAWREVLVAGGRKGVCLFY